MDKDSTNTLEIKGKSKNLFIPEEKIDEIDNLPILDVANRLGIELKKAGVSYTTHCPAHNEKTPSFTVSPAKNICNCFGCGVGGGPVQLVMLYQKLEWLDAVKWLAKEFNISIPKRELTPEEKQRYSDREQIIVTYEAALKYFTSNVKGEALSYISKRWNTSSINDWRIGFAPDQWQGLENWAQKNGITKDALIKASLLTQSNGRAFDFFRNRVIFPIKNGYGRIVGFTGRYIGDDPKQPKYLNTPENPAFNKSEVLFGIHFAQNDIRKLDNVILVEGNPDVISLHGLGIANTVAPMGTAISEKQYEALKRYCRSITFIPDTDEPGLKALEKNAKKALEYGFLVSVLMLPEEKDENGQPIKHDADSYFKSIEQFNEYKKANTHDFIEWFYKRNLKPGDRNQQIATIDKIVSILATKAGQSNLDYYLTNLARIVPNKRYWSDKVNSFVKEKEKSKLNKDKEVDFSLLERYGFYEKKNSLYFQTKNGTIRGANFILVPISHVVSTTNSKRLYLMRNEFGFEKIIELSQDDLVSLSKFRKAVESQGNFIWEAGESELIKYKRYLYEKTDTCYEVTQLGWQPKDDCFAWGNGIFNGSFKQCDEYGIVKQNNKNLFLPAFSKAWEDEKEFFQFERNFIFRYDGTVSLYDYTSLFIKVYGNNGIVGLCFLFSSLFRDIIVRTTHNYPLLNMFGPKGAGKTEMGKSLMSFFVRRNIPPNLNNSTVPSINEAISQCCNAMVHLDEYKNDLDFIKIELLKGIYDGTGRTRMNMDRDKKRETTSVDSGVMVSGQEMPTADIALFSRLIFLAFHKVTYSQEEKSNFEKLKEFDEVGLTHLTHEILSKREVMLDSWLENYNKTSLTFQDKLKGSLIEDRIFRNWLILAATFKALENHLTLPFTYTEVEKICLEGIKEQNEKTCSSNEVSNFWNTIDVVVANGQMRWNVDFVVRETTRLKTDIIDKKNGWNEGESKMVLYINHTLALDFYAKHCKSKVLPRETMMYYLRNSKMYLGEKKAHKFYKWNHDAKGFALNSSGEKLAKVTNVMCFEYDPLNLNIHEANPFSYDDSEIIDKDEISNYLENASNEEPVLAVNKNDELPF